MRRPKPEPEKDRIYISPAPETGQTAASARKKGRQQKTPTVPEQSDPDPQAPSVGNCPTVWALSEDDGPLPPKASSRPRRNQKLQDASSSRPSEEPSAGWAKRKLPRLPSHTGQKPTVPEGSAKPKRRRLPDLETVLDAFDPVDDALEPEPEPGDFWIEPDDWEIP